MFSRFFRTVAAASLAVAAVGLVAVEADAQSRDRHDRRVRIINNTGQTMTMFHASNVNTKSWEEDILGRGVLRSGQSVVINIDDGTGHCLYDFKATFENGQQLVRRRQNVCELTTFTYN